MPTPFRTLAAAILLAFAASGAAWAQGGAGTEDAATTEQGDAPPPVAGDDGAGAGVAVENPAPADASTTEGGPVEPTDATDGADTAATDASGNSQDDPNPRLDPEGGEEIQGQPDQALPVIGQPVHGGINFQPAATELARDQQWLDGMLNAIMAVVAVFVMLLLLWVIVRFNEGRNTKPARFTHNSPLEIAWTIVPIVILVFIGAFSLPVLFEQQEIPEGDVHIKITGNQWFWTYEYPDEGIAFDSYMVGYGEPAMTDAPDDPIRVELEAAGFTDDQYKLATDTALVLPVGAVVVATVTGADVIHSWSVPAFGVKQDAVPGRLAQLWFAAEQEGVFFGQCYELCGKDHAFMPIQVRVVSPDAYQAWLEEARAEFPAS